MLEPYPRTRRALGEAIRDARRVAGLSIDRAAAAWGVAPGTVKRVERGNPTRRSSLEAIVGAADLPAGTRRAVEGLLDRPYLAERFELVAEFDAATWTAVAPLLGHLAARQ